MLVYLVGWRVGCSAPVGKMPPPLLLCGAVTASAALATKDVRADHPAPALEATWLPTPEWDTSAVFAAMVAPAACNFGATTAAVCATTEPVYFAAEKKLDERDPKKSSLLVGAATC